MQSITNGQGMSPNPIPQERIQSNLRFHKMFLWLFQEKLIFSVYVYMNQSLTKKIRIFFSSFDKKITENKR